MLDFKRKQMAAVGLSQLQGNIVDFLRRHFPEETAAMPVETLHANVAGLIEQCRKRGLTSQRAIAAYALSAFVCGSDTVATDPALTQLLSDRRTPADERGRLVEIWLANTWQQYDLQTSEPA